MAAAPATLKIARTDGPLKTTTPHLMPFHIAYSGPAPISTYFRVHAAPEPTYGREKKPEAPVPSEPESQQTSDSQATLVASPAHPSPTPALPPSDSAATLVNADVHDSANASSSPADFCSRHFTAAFRGRSLHGLKVDLPHGYAGVVLRSPDDHKTSAPPSSAGGSRTRSKGARGNAKRSHREEEDVIDVDEEMPDADDEGPVRLLTPAAQFSSFVLWHPDIPVDEGRDEYLRSLTEWTRLAAEIHRVEEC
ncbi:hypothetical protein BV20DRAFT_1024243 [Pilatotrama ljubarskyi]|nr:hypothetical protein BV20DRAFT_1024243 [Pilatotrama ljubarskyi]